MANKLFIGNIAHTTNESSLETLFSTAGSVVSVRIITDKMSGRSKGFGFVEMSAAAEAAAAITTFDGKDHDGRPLRVSEARPQENRTGGASFNGRGGFESKPRRFGSRGY
jgi:cold-inducible RNA-binding protein